MPHKIESPVSADLELLARNNFNDAVQIIKDYGVDNSRRSHMAPSQTERYARMVDGMTAPIVKVPIITHRVTEPVTVDVEGEPKAYVLERELGDKINGDPVNEDINLFSIEPSANKNEAPARKFEYELTHLSAFSRTEGEFTTPDQFSALEKKLASIEEVLKSKLAARTKAASNGAQSK